MEWIRGETIGYGSFASVSLAKPIFIVDDFPKLFAVKSCQASCSASLMSEKEVLKKMKSCPHIIRFFGDEISYEKGEMFYNLLIEYADGGDMSLKIKNSGEGKLPEEEVKRYTRSVVQGLKFIHENGFVHCDIKPKNVLLCSAGENGLEVAKIADFGLAKIAGEKIGVELRGTPLYMSPEMVKDGEQESPSDIWALGCLVTEMITGNPVWRFRAGENHFGLFMRIGASDESPEIPTDMSDEGKDFLGKCFIRDPKQRWTAEELLSHPFIASNEEDEVHVKLTSPRCPFDFLNQNNLVWSNSITSLPSFHEERLQQVIVESPNWSNSSWFAVR
ncbi:mitogen-activated protein kinase kinase kinase 20-like [Impatiens glandulifera]|uniref:mitogen-activated protein kinase kinase kinase 20-like n=1 Tax=Impatiens glandulifera TaxID=253017 RepID=UPI001FB1073C|nr:mitogen-activated protein kinase kinase kinase 20-like [Impatiens glandulifera]